MKHRRLFLMLLTICLCVGLFSVTASAVSGDCGELSWSLEDGTLTISGSGRMDDYDYYTTVAPWYDHVEDIKTIVIESGVTYIGDFAFVDCINATGVTIPDSVTVIGNYAFAYCSALKDVTIPGSVSNIGNHAFDSCYAMTAIKIPASVTSLGDGVFSSCVALKKVTVASANEKYRSVDGILYNKGKTKLLCVPGGYSGNFTVPGTVTTIADSAFSGCMNLSGVTIPNSVTRIGYGAFYLCEGLTSVTLPNSVKNLGEMVFAGCYALESITLSSNLSKIPAYAFFYCEKLQEIRIPAGATSIGECAFLYCTDLTSVTIPGSVKSIEYGAFANCAALDMVAFLGDAPTFGDDVMHNTTPTCCYPSGNKTWTDSVKNKASQAKWVTITAAPVVTVSNVAKTGKIKLTWDAVENAAAYKVYRSDTKTGTYKLMFTTANTSYTNTSAKAENAYWYKVEAVAADGVAGMTCAPVKGVCDLPRPMVNITNDDAGKPVLSWSPVEGAVKYQVWRCVTKDGKYGLMKTVTGTTYTNLNAVAGKLYYYKVVAVAEKPAANSAPSAIQSRTCDIARTVVSVKLNDNGQPQLSWKAVPGATGYTIYRATKENGKYFVMKTVTGTTYTNLSAKGGKTYYYKVVALAKNPNANSTSAVISARCRLDAPEVTVKLDKNGKPVLSWNPVEGAVKYQVWRCVNKNGTYGLMKTVTGTSYTNLNAKAGKTYYYKVVAVADTVGYNSNYSKIVSVKT